jgi:hypothetical protein
MPWKKCLAEMWLKDRPGGSTPDNNTRVVRITKHNEPLVGPLLHRYNLIAGDEFLGWQDFQLRN